jgi:RNA polymerase sigma-70 factor (ECF subfamily)
VPDIDAERRFTALYDAHHRQVYAYVVSKAGRHLADEVVSDTFTVAWRRFRDLPDPALPWLLGVARNLLHEQARSARSRESLAAELRTWAGTQEWVQTDPADVVAERAAVRAALAGLGDEDRELLTLVAWHGLSTAQAAQVVGCSSATYSVRLHRARKRLEQALEDAPARRYSYVPGKDAAR